MDGCATNTHTVNCSSPADFTGRNLRASPGHKKSTEILRLYIKKKDAIIAELISAMIKINFPHSVAIIIGVNP